MSISDFGVAARAEVLALQEVLTRRLLPDREAHVDTGRLAHQRIDSENPG